MNLGKIFILHEPRFSHLHDGVSNARFKGLEINNIFSVLCIGSAHSRPHNFLLSLQCHLGGWCCPWSLGLASASRFVLYLNAHPIVPPSEKV